MFICVSLLYSRSNNVWWTIQAILRLIKQSSELRPIKPRTYVCLLMTLHHLNLEFKFFCILHLFIWSTNTVKIRFLSLLFRLPLVFLFLVLKINRNCRTVKFHQFVFVLRHYCEWDAECLSLSLSRSCHCSKATVHCVSQGLEILILKGRSPVRFQVYSHDWFIRLSAELHDNPGVFEQGAIKHMLYCSSGGPGIPLKGLDPLSERCWNLYVCHDTELFEAVLHLRNQNINDINVDVLVFLRR